MIKNLVRSVLPGWLLMFRKKQWILKVFRKAFDYDLERYIEYSRTISNDNPEKLIGEIITIYHALEKGLTMPEIRLGFGTDKVIKLCNLCISYIDRYGSSDDQLIHAIRVILEYEKFHSECQFHLDPETLKQIAKLKRYRHDLQPSKQHAFSKPDYFRHSKSNFLDFSNSRASLRNFGSMDIAPERIIQALDLAKNTPSACNRQSWRTYIYSDRTQINDILKVQGGNTGFGHLTNKLIVISGELGVFSEAAERNQVFVDGGMYAMNLLYALHYYEIGACIINCSASPEKDIELRKRCNIRHSEVFIAMIVCGIPPETFNTTISKRHPVERTNTMVIR